MPKDLGTSFGSQSLGSGTPPGAVSNVLPQGRRVSGRLILALALLAGIAPFAIDMYLPALPLMAGELRADVTSIQLSLTAIMAGLALGQLVFGPVSDRWGRKGPILVGTAAVALSGLLTALAPDVLTLNLGRFLQGLGGAAGIVIGRAIVRDLAHGREAARAYSMFATVTAIAPVLAPFLGGLLVPWVGWRGVMSAVGLLGALMFIVCLLVVPETLPRGRTRAVGFVPSLAPMLQLAKNRQFAIRAGVLILSFGAFITYVVSSAYVYQNAFGLTPTAFGVVFALNAVGLAAGSAMAARLVLRWPLQNVVTVGLVLAATGTGAGLCAVLADLGWVWFTALVFLSMTGFGLAYGSSTALAMELSGASAGSASALLGFLQFGFGAIAAPYIGTWSESTPIPMVACMLALSLGALTLHRVKGIRTRRGQ